MCWSEPVSFVVGGTLIAGGVFAGWKAIRINKRYFPVSQMPTLAGLQQLLEGHVWMGVNTVDPSMIWWASMGYIFFSWLMWPVWIPFSIYFLEPPASRRKLPLLGFVMAGLAFGLILYVPHIFHPEWVDVSISRHSLAYEDTMFLDYLIPRALTYSIYIFLLVTPAMISTYLHMRLFGLTLIAVLVVVYAFLTYAYISFFCLLAGLATFHLIYIIVRNKCCRECPELFG
tara:strand:+ start:164 stop:850 length:687 start_codon:yes stop_codon:yes gene_type:complete